MTVTATWVAPPVWSVPRMWEGERCFIICGGESVRDQRRLIPHLQGRVVAVKHGVILRPDADVLFFAGERPAEVAPPLLKIYRGSLIVVRGKGHPVFPSHAKRIGRTTNHDQLSEEPTQLCGFDAGTSALNLATLAGAKEVALIGYDMRGGRWFTGEVPHYLPNPPESDFQRHMAPLASIAADAKAKGIRIVNCSPISRVTAFERQPLEMFL